MHNFKMKLLYNGEELFYSKRELLNFKITLPLAKLNMVVSKLVSNGLIFSDDILIDIKLANFLLLPNISQLSIGANTKKF